MNLESVSSVIGEDLFSRFISVCVHLTWTLAHFAWQGSVIAALFAVTNFALRTKSSNARYLNGLFALLCLALCPLLTYSLFPSQEFRDHRNVDPSIVVNRAHTQHSDQKTSAIATGRNPSFVPTADEDFESEFDTVAGTVVDVNLTAAALCVVTLYLIGLIVMISRLAFQLSCSRRFVTNSYVNSENRIEAFINRACERWAIRLIPVVAVCEQVTTPVVVGLLRPMILLPPALLTGLSFDQIEAVLTHELAHLRRFDLFFNLVQRIVESLLFFHPAVWYVSHRISIERERACDELVISSGLNPSAYCRALLRTAEICSAPTTSKSILLASSGDDPSEFKQRILNLLGETPSPSRRLTRSGSSGFVATIGLLLLASIMLTQLPLADTPPSRKPSQRHQLPQAAHPVPLDLTPVEISDSVELDELVIEGNTAIPTAEILKHIKTQPGRPVTQKQIKDDVDTLVRTRWFASVEPTFRHTDGRVELIFRVLERPIVRRVEYKGLKKVKQKVFDSLTQLKPGSPFDVSSNRECVRRIEEYYHEKGFAFATVELEIGNARDDREVVFLITEGPKVHVNSIRLFGDPVFVEGVLNEGKPEKSRILNLAVGKTDSTSRSLGAEEIKRYYHQLGYFDVKIRELPDAGGDRSDGGYEIKEGLRYQIRNLEIAGNHVFPKGDFIPVVQVSEGKPFDARKIRDHVIAIKSRYDRAGLFLTRVDAVPRWTETAGQIDVVIEISESVEAPDEADMF